MKRISSYFAPTPAKINKLNEATGVLNKVEKPPTKESNDSTISSNKTVTETSASKKRDFQRTWLSDDRFKNWLVFDHDKKCMTCSTCIKTCKKNPFVVGCNNFRTSTLLRHKASTDHVNSLLDNKEQTNFRQKVETAFDQKKNAIICALRSVYWLCKEKIATIKFGSLLNLMKLQGCADIENLHSGDNATYQSDRAAEEFQDAISSVIESDLKDKLASCNVVSLMCDESDDISVQKKMVCFVKFIPKDSNFQPEILFLENVTIDKGDAETVYTNLKAAACEKGIDMNKVMFFGSDGASVMTGKKNGVSARLLEDQPCIVNIHCMAHKLALCTSQAADSVTYLKKYREILTNVFYHFKHSSLRTSNLSKIESVLNDKHLKIKEIHAVRWFAFFSALEAIYHTWGSLVTYFEQEKQSEKGGVAKGIHSQLTQFEFIGVTYLLMDIMPILTKLSLSFQKENIDISVVKPLVQSTVSQMEYLLDNDGPYMQEFHSAVNENQLQIRDHNVSVTKIKQTHFRNIRTEFIGQVIAQLHRRFPADDTSVVSALAILGLRGISFVAKDQLPEHGKDEIELLCQTYGTSKNEKPAYIDQHSLKMEWELLKPLVLQQRYPTDNIFFLWQLIFIHHKELFPTILKLAELALIAPLQTADCERGFSTQNDIKSSDRNRLSADRLNKLMRISLNKASVDAFDYGKALRAWKAVKQRRAFQL